MSSDAPDFTLPSVLLDRYLAGECTPDERARVEAWARARGAAAALHILRDGGQSPASTNPARQAADWDTIARRLGLATPAGGRSDVPPRPATPYRSVASRTRPARQWVPLASLAGVAVAIGVTLATGYPRPHTPNTASAAEARGGVVYRTNVGQVATVRLGDGSRVTLAPQTTLRLDRDFGVSGRTVALSGEARFEVVNRTGLPFVVRTGVVTTRVLGTTFTIRRYATDAAVCVAVLSGKVTVGARTARRPALTLTAGAVGLVSDSLATLLTSDGAGAYARWTDGRLVFHNAPTHEVLAALARWYGYEFRLADSSLAAQHLTVWLSTTSAQAALATLKLALDADMTFDGNAITLSPREMVRRGAPKARDRRDVHDIFPTQSREIGR